MLRALVLLLVLANGLLWAWGQGWLAPLLATPEHHQREPARLQRQVSPDAVRLLAPPEARAALGEAVRADEARAAQASEAAASGPTSSGSAGSAAASSAPAPSAAAGAQSSCWEAGPVEPAQLPALERSLREAPAAAGLRWTVRRGERGGQFIVYMGRYNDRSLLQRKQDELRGLGVSSIEVADSPSLSPGLQLGELHNERGAAERQLTELGRRGVKTARVAMLVAPTPLLWLRVDKVTSAQAAQLAAMPALGPAGPAQLKLTACG